MSEAGFSPTNLQKLIVFVISELNRGIGAIELAKLIYLIDVEKMKLTGQTMTGEEYVRLQKGPLARNFQNCINEIDDYEIKITVGPSRGFSQFEKKEHEIGGNPRAEFSLDSIDLVIARKVLNRIGHLRPLALERLSYDTEPMQDILQREKEAGDFLKGETLDLNLIKPDLGLQLWRENMKTEQELDPEYEEFLKIENQEIDRILAELG